MTKLKTTKHVAKTQPEAANTHDAVKTAGLMTCLVDLVVVLSESKGGLPSA